jgi:hypothetical protein
MKVDMSPEAVTARLRTLDELWLLSVKLMNSKRVTKSYGDLKKQNALEIQDSIRQVLLRDWDPIGICCDPSVADEYDAFIAPIYRILVGTRSEDDLIDCLRRIERDEIGVDPSEAETLRPVAKMLLELKIMLD